ncbi:MAG: amidase [Gammaproteobacteria bacterium]|nr:amidase [Gammaproteobacteria bacterium]
MATINRRDFLRGTACLAGGMALSGVLTAAYARQGMSFAEYRQHDALSLAQLLRNKDVTAQELLELAISRNETVHPLINSIVLDHSDLARTSLENGLPQGPFAGVPFLLKDLGIAMAGTVTTQGSRFFQDDRAEGDDPFMRKVRAAGLVTFGKTHSPEFGNNPSTESSLFGYTRNPWNTELSVGGSSGGAAAAVAAGILPVAHASDGGGSIRIPASACGLFGLKPSRGLVPIGSGEGEVRGGLSAQHVISRSVRDSAALLDVFAWSNPGRTFPDHSGADSYLSQVQREPGKLRIALMRSPLQPFPVDPQCVAAVEHAAKLCQELGHFVEEAAPEMDIASVGRSSGTLSVVSLAQRISQQEAALGREVTSNDLERANLELLEWGRQVSAVDYALALDGVHQAAREMAAFMDSYDMILSPTMAQLPPRLGEVSLDLPLEEFGPRASRMSTFASLYNLTGQPAMSVPLYWTPDGLPVGVMFAARHGDERALIRLAAQLESAMPWFDKVPTLAT